nr:aldehyde dehydrogenase family protein [Micromonospora sp. DSM 115978]
AIVVGDPTDPMTRLGPMVTSEHRERVLAHVRSGVAEGARLVCGGGRPGWTRRGWYVEPTVFVDVDNSMRVAQEEIFGPVLTVTPYDTLDEAVEIANDTEYGLSGSVWGADPAHAAVVATRIRAGSVYVNGAFALDADAPFGGFKQSGVGREGGPDSLGEYLEPQVVYTQRDKRP